MCVAEKQAGLPAHVVHVRLPVRVLGDPEGAGGVLQVPAARGREQSARSGVSGPGVRVAAPGQRLRQLVRGSAFGQGPPRPAGRLLPPDRVAPKTQQRQFNRTTSKSCIRLQSL